MPDQCLQLLSVSLSFEGDRFGREGRYPSVSAAFARGTMIAGSRQAHADPTALEEVNKLISPLVKRLWFGDARDATGLEVFYRMLADVEPSRNEDWFRGRVETIETVYRQSRRAEAEAEVARIRIDFPEMSEDQRAKLGFDEGTILFDKEAYGLAIGPLSDGA